MLNRLKKIKINYYVDALLLVFLLIFPTFGSLFRTEQMTRYMCYVILAISLDLLWGYAGQLSLGHSVLFGLGGYIFAISYSVKDGVPGFMSNLGITELPSFMKILQNQAVGIAAAIIIPGLFAFLIGIFLFSSKIGGMFFAVISFAMITLFGLFINNQSAYTGGANGITGIGHFVIGGHKLNVTEMYFLVLAFVVLVYFFTRWLTSTKYGIIIKASSEYEDRVKFLGFNTPFFKAVMYGISGAIAGLAGTLFVPVSGIIAPTDVTGTLSTILIIALAVGGKGNLTGGMLGILIFEWGQSILSESFSDYWQLLLGILVILFVFYMPEGIIGKLLFMQERIGMRHDRKVREEKKS